MNKTQTYTVAGHPFCLLNEEHDPMWERMTPQYAPFADTCVGEPLFTATVCHALHDAESPLPEAENSHLVYKDPNPHPAEAKIDIYRHAGGAHLFCLMPPGGGAEQGGSEHSLLHLSADLRTARLLLRGTEAERFCGLNTALMLCYLLATVRTDTALMHASAVVNNGKAYLFLGRSGTGKSTHSTLWLQHIPGSELLNDDHPIIRLTPDGQAIAYGSPWSGKTPCYRNESAPVGAIVRIKRAPQNSIRLLTPIEAYASLATSCSGMSWDGEFADGKDRTLQALIAAVPCYTLGCLPDREAAEICAAAVRKETETPIRKETPCSE